MDKHDLYFNAYYKTIIEYSKAYEENPEQDLNPLVRKAIIYGVKAVNTKKKSEYLIQEEVEKDFAFANIVQEMMGLLTPKEFMNLFPIDKEYDGDKYGVKDYYYTMNYIKGLDQDKHIGENIFDFLWEYHNLEISRFSVNALCCISDLRKLDGHPSLMEEFAEENGIKTYSMHTDEQGQQFLFDKETGKTMKLNKSRPRYLKVLK